MWYNVEWRRKGTGKITTKPREFYNNHYCYSNWKFRCRNGYDNRSFSVQAKKVFEKVNNFSLVPGYTILWHLFWQWIYYYRSERYFSMLKNSTECFHKICQHMYGVKFDFFFTDIPWNRMSEVIWNGVHHKINYFYYFNFTERRTSIHNWLKFRFILFLDCYWMETNCIYSERTLD